MTAVIQATVCDVNDGTSGREIPPAEAPLFQSLSRDEGVTWESFQRKQMRHCWLIQMSPQYRGIFGSIFSAHSSIPPFMENAFSTPMDRRKCVARSDLTPWWQ